MVSSRCARALAAVLAAVPALLTAGEAHAYIGPGAGFAFVGSLMVLITTFAIALAIILTWPIRLLYRYFTVGNPYKNARSRRVVILGLDGMDPGLVTRFMRDGRMPNFQKLAERGVFRPLDTSVPSMSPVAWSTFATGVDASRHCIYDFLTRDPCTYAPIAELDGHRGRQARAQHRPLHDSARQAADEAACRRVSTSGSCSATRTSSRSSSACPSRSRRCPSRMRLLLSGMCVPDLRGSQGTFSFFSTETARRRGEVRGRRADRAAAPRR